MIENLADFALGLPIAAYQAAGALREARRFSDEMLSSYGDAPLIFQALATFGGLGLGIWLQWLGWGASERGLWLRAGCYWAAGVCLAGFGLLTLGAFFS